MKDGYRLHKLYVMDLDDFKKSFNCFYLCTAVIGLYSLLFCILKCLVCILCKFLWNYLNQIIYLVITIQKLSCKKTAVYLLNGQKT